MALINVPLAGQTLAATRGPINQNFATINTAFAVDHVVYNIAGQGQHNKVTFPVQALAPVFGGLNGLWSQLYATTAKNELWLNNIGTGQQIPLSACILSTNAAPPADSTGWTYLPSGILMKWGVASASLAGTVVNLNAGGALGPNFAQAINASVSPRAAGSNVRILITGAGQITLLADAATSCYFFVIGRS